MANGRFPVEVNGAFPVLDQMRKEGRPATFGDLSYSNPNIPSQVLAGTARLQYTAWQNPASNFSGIVPPGETWVGVSLLITSDRPCIVNGFVYVMSGMQIGEDGVSLPVAAVIGPQCAPVTIPLPAVMYEGSRITITFSAAGTTAAPIEQPVTAVMPIGGVSVTSDHNYGAKKIVVGMGDSISWNGPKLGYKEASTQRVSGRAFFNHQVCDALRASGRDVRLIQRGWGSAIASEADTAFSAGWFDGIAYDLIICSRGTNDVPAVADSAAELAFKTSLKRVIEHRDTYRPKASIIFVAPFPTDNPSGRTLANLPAVRQWVQDVATDSVVGGTSRHVYFYNGGTAFTMNATASADTYFAGGASGAAGERVAGGRLHLGKAGHDAAFAGLWPVVQTTDFYMNW